jgi:leucyl-tRNA synthetase
MVKKETKKVIKKEESRGVDFSAIEKKWQEAWEKSKVFEVQENLKKKKFYVLEMFPYPSGAGIHMGHAFNYTIGDIFSRYKLMNGFNVLHPMGFDSLGLPAENAAIKEKQHPEIYTNNSIKNFVKQQKTLGLTYDWSRQVNTADSEYYRWDQWIFLKMFEKGLVYEKEAPVNWCPKCNTILANEQVQGGKCWRHEDTDVEIKNVRQLFIKITDYADRLLEGHKKLNWPEKTIAMQKNWIGKSFGTEIDFEINGKKWPIFTTRPDTLFGVTFMVVSAQHQKLNELVTKAQRKEVDKFLKKLKSVSEKELESLEKEGVFTGSYAINPATNEKVPVYVGNFVVADYGCGMVMAVPAHDQRDFEFAKKYKIPIKQVIEGNLTSERAWADLGKLINSKGFNGISNEEAKKKITDWLVGKKLARKVVNYKLRDWSVARQRYWGTPIPLVHCEKCGLVPIPEKDLPVKLPKEVKFGEGNPLLTNKEWLNVKCPKCGGKAQREANTMDTFVNSSWYFLRYCDPKNNKEIFDKKKVKYWMPIDLYIGGAEHACMHLIYFRFYNMFLHDIGLVDFDEPAPRLFHQGMINGYDGQRMSKSKGNGVEPLETMKKYGVDTTRFYLMSEASPDKGFNWNDSGIQGSLRIINKVSTILNNLKFGKDSKELEVKLNNSIKNITEQIESLDYRKSTIELRELFDLIAQQKEISKESFASAIKLLSPFCPHIAEEIWEKIGMNKSGKDFVSIAEWPKVDEKKLKLTGDSSSLEEKMINYIKSITDKFPDKKNVFVYVMPFEIGKISAEKISKATGKMVDIWSVNDKDKFDPNNRASKARPGMPGIHLE